MSAPANRLRNTGANLVKTTAEPQKEDAPRARILATARELFYRHGIRAIGVEAIAQAARTNKMTHFPSRDELVI
jgi:AcrR family transcriptional regulator